VAKTRAMKRPGPMVAVRVPYLMTR
jgi:hypothetical protein